MRLRQRTLLILATTLALLMLSFYVVLGPLVMRDYADLENRSMIRNTHRVVDDIEHQAAEMNSNASDWSNIARINVP